MCSALWKALWKKKLTGQPQPSLSEGDLSVNPEPRQQNEVNSGTRRGSVLWENRGRKWVLAQEQEVAWEEELRAGPSAFPLPVQSAGLPGLFPLSSVELVPAAGDAVGIL